MLDYATKLTDNELFEFANSILSRTRDFVEQIDALEKVADDTDGPRRVREAVCNFRQTLAVVQQELEMLPEYGAVIAKLEKDRRDLIQRVIDESSADEDDEIRTQQYDVCRLLIAAGREKGATLGQCNAGLCHEGLPEISDVHELERLLDGGDNKAAA